MSKYKEEHPDEALTSYPEDLQEFWFLEFDITDILSSSYTYNQRNQSLTKIQDKYIEEYKNKCLELGRNITSSDQCYFSNGREMSSWYIRKKSRYRRVDKSSSFFNKERYEHFLNLTLFLLEKGYDNKPLTVVKLTEEERMDTFLRLYEELGDIQMFDAQNLYFSDNRRIFNWYINRVAKIKRGRRQNKVLNEKQMKKVEEFAWMENEMLKLHDACYVRTSKIPFTERKKFFLDVVRILQRLPERGEFSFSDGSDFYEWYLINRKKVPVSKQYLKEESPRLSYEEYAKEYLEKTKELGRKIRDREEYMFSTKESMAKWYTNQSALFRKQFLTKQAVSKSRVEEAHRMALIEDYILTIDPKSLPSISRIPFLERIEKYKQKVRELGRNLNSHDNFLFSDVDKMNMYSWYLDTCRKNHSGYLLSEEEKAAWEELESIIQEYIERKSRNKNNEPRQIKNLEVFIEEYRDILFKLGRKPVKKDHIHLSSGVLANYFFDNEEIRLIRERRNNKNMTSTRLNRAHAFALLENDIWNLEHENESAKRMKKEL